MASSWNAVARSTSRERLTSALVSASDRCGRAASRAANAVVSVDQSIGRHDSVDESDALGVRGAEVIAQEQELLGPLQADQAREQPRSTSVGDDSSPHEDLDEPRFLDRHDEVTGQREMGTDAGGGAIDRGDDRLLAVEHGTDEPLRAGADEPGDVARGLLGCVVRPGDLALGSPQVGARAEGAVPGGSDHDAADLELLRGLVELAYQPVSLVGRESVAGFGPIEGEPAHTSARLGPQLLAERSVLSHGGAEYGES